MSETTVTDVAVERLGVSAYTLPLENIWREDEERPSLPVEEVLANAPLREGHFFRVRRVLE